MTVLLFLFISIALTVRNFLLRSTPFFDWDEGIYAQVAREILQNGTLATTFNGTLWLNKPPLVHGLIAVIFSFFGEHVFPARMIMVAGSVFLLFLTYRLTKSIYYELFPQILHKFSLFEQRLILTYPVLVLASAPVFLERSTILNTDIFLGIGWVGYFLYRKSFWLRLLFLSIGVLSKSFLGIYPLLFEVLLIRRKSITKLSVLKSIALAIIPFTWHIYSFIRYGNYFIQAHVADQVVKRVVAPIELHFGNFYYYPLLLWRNVDGVAFFMSVGYLYIFISLYKMARGRALLSARPATLWPYIILLSPLPYFILLTFMKSKIPWYMVSVLPLFCIIIPYCFMILKDTLYRRTAMAFVLVFFFIPFLANTILLKPSPVIPQKVSIAQCISSVPGTSISVAVDKQERDVRNVLEAAQLQTATSFIYGGSPSFVFYSRKHVNYHYTVEEFAEQYERSDIAMISNADLIHYPNLKQRFAEYTKSDCSTDDWSVFIKPIL